jgi:glycosyltransferase involved in cell wall biosynthesis
LRILQLIDTLHAGGAERMCVNIANVLHESGIDVQICATREGGSLKSFINPGVKTHVLNKRNSFDISAFRKFIRILKKEKIDLIHAHSSSLIWAVTAKLFVKNLRVIWHDHLGRRVHDYKRNFFYRLISTKIDAIIAVNKDLETWAKRNMNITSERIFQLNNFPLLRETAELQSHEDIVIVCLANFLPAKDHETLIRAIDIVIKNEVDRSIKLVLAGAFRQDHYYFNLKSLITELNLNSNVKFTGSVEDTTTLLARSDIGVLSSRTEGMPLSLLEYGMACLPVVVTDVGQCAEVVGNGRYGLVVPPGKPELLAKELLWIIQNKESAVQMGTGFKKHVIEEYGHGQFLTQYQDLLKKIFFNDQLPV